MNLPKNYFQAETFLGKANSKRIHGIRSTKIERLSDTEIALIYHQTRVVIFHYNGDITLNSDGYRTKTTKDRMNSVISYPIYQKNYRWFVSTPENPSLPYYDGMVINNPPT